MPSSRVREEEQESPGIRAQPVSNHALPVHKLSLSGLLIITRRDGWRTILNRPYRRITTLNETLDAALKAPARHQHIAPAGCALNANVQSHSQNAPRLAATRVRFAQFDNVTNAQV
jgi:hypothetical protein